MRRSFYRTARLCALLAIAAFVCAPVTLRAAANTAADTKLNRDAPNAQAVDVKAIDAYVTSQMRAMHIPGVALGVVRGDQIVHLRGFGVSNPRGERVTPQTPFILGSTSKSFTALAIMQLLEAGKVSLDAPVQRYLPWFQVGPSTHSPSASSAITIRHLLNQVSGIPTRAVEATLTGDGSETLEQEVRALRQVTLTAPAGTTYQYSNMNYSTLGLVVQAVSGQSFGQYIQQHIFEPLQMENSFVSQSEAREHGMATGYRWWFGLAVPADLPYLSASLPAGFLISSAQDMAHYLIAHVNEGRYQGASVLSPGGMVQLHQPAARMNLRDAGERGGGGALGVHEEGDAYGMGWVISPSSGSLGVPSIWHGGDTANFHSDMIVLPQQQWGIVVLMNVNGNFARMSDAQGIIAQGVARILLGRQAPEESAFQQHYLLLDRIILLGTGLVMWSFAKVLKRRSRPWRRSPVGLLTSFALPVLWEVALPLLILVGFPPLVQASWPLILLYFPDLGYWLIVLCLLLLATGATRLARVRSRLRQNETFSPTPEEMPALGPAVK
jgi:CubicO group peptidase (beta-lactamase class C family)